MNVYLNSYSFYMIQNTGLEHIFFLGIMSEIDISECKRLNIQINSRYGITFFR